jgi:glycosyltransferase involved in cell wall biosynthesis
LHVGFLIYDDLSVISGGYLYDRKLVEYLRSCGDKVSVISIKRKNYALNLVDNCSYTLLKKLYNLNVDILIEDELNHPSLFLINYLLRKKINYPIISIIHHLRSQERYMKLLEKFYRCIESRYLNGIDGFIYNSDTSKYIVETLSRCIKPSVVVYPGRDHFEVNIAEDDVVNRVRNTEILKILFLGNIIPRKGLHILFSALDRLQIDNWILNVIGQLDSKGSYTKKVKRLIRKKRIENKVYFLGLLSDKELILYLKRSDILVVPSFYEGFGIVYLEGMGFGLPVIATSNGGAKEIIRHGNEGFLVEPDDFVSISNYIEMLCRDKDLLLEMSLNALKRHMSFSKWKSSTSKIRGFLKSFIE